MILRTEMKTLQKCTYNYSNADVIGMKSYMRRIKWNKELQNYYVPKKTGRKRERKKQCGWTVPLYKKGAKNHPSNYRPIRLTSVVCKILESMIKDAISKHLESNTLYKGSQHGFSLGKSCLTNLLIYLEQVTSEIDKGVPVDTLYLDFAKTFDTVPHLRLIEKIAANGIGVKISKWIKC